MTHETITILKSFAEAGTTAAPVALLAAAAALPHLLTLGHAAAPVRVPARRARRIWGREEGFTTSSPRR